jgi:DNA-binding NarL/FixJ family response regulator
MPTIKVLIVDDNAKFIESVKKLLSNEQDIEVIGEATEGKKAILKAKELKPDIVLMDVRMPEMNGLKATRRISQIMPETKIIILTIYDIDEYRDAAINSGQGFFMKKVEIENLEVELLVEAIFKRYGYDFRHYSRASFKRRINNFLGKTSFNKPTEIIPQLLYDKALSASLLYNLSITVTEMFRDPFVYKAIRKNIVGFLKTYPFIKIWHAGCATGEEAYSMAILLKEEGLYDRTQIYATDFNDEALEKAKRGIYPVDCIKEYTVNYS